MRWGGGGVLTCRQERRVLSTLSLHVLELL
jgi:hypothetical protein